jgi:P-type Cu+ transporter
MEVADPVCGMKFDEDEAAVSLEYQGEAYHFCSRACMDTFEAEPAKYITTAAAGA